MVAREANHAQNLQQLEAIKAQKKAKEVALERRLAKEARAHERRAKRDE